MIKYLGSKRLLCTPIVAAAHGFGGVQRVLDLFSGTARVGRAFKESGLTVTANDHLAFAHVLARCYVAADRTRWLEPATALLDELARVPPEEGYFTQAFCRDARYIQPKNGARIDAIRDAIAERELPEPLEAIALTALMEAADRVDSTTGVQMAYLKKWSQRSVKDLELRVPAMLDGEGTALCLDAAEAAEMDVDVAYLDPPYNQHSYLGNYHVWETLVRRDAPEAYGVANKRVACREYKNPFNSRVRIEEAFRAVVERTRAPHLIVSFNDEGFLDRDTLLTILRARGEVRVVEVDFKRYVGAQIGIFNPKGDKVGRVSHLRNREMLFLVSADRARVDAAERACREALAAPSKPGVALSPR
ncbi:MAG: DNA adenine methylase [Sandaracinaceae bacterium]